MILVSGSASSGKLEYVKSLGYRDCDIADSEINTRPVVYGLQNIIFQGNAAIDELVPVLLKKEVVVCNEVGSGVIPIDRHERLSREMTGRLCNILAQHAEKVIRIVCGIPVIIKDKP